MTHKPLAATIAALALIVFGPGRRDESAAAAAPDDGGEVMSAAVFRSGEGGYHTYRIPSLIVSPQGTLLAFCEGRKNGRGDSGDIDLLLRRSLDGGQTWEPAQVVADHGPDTIGNPCPVVERESGAIVLLLTGNRGDDSEDEILEGTAKGTRTVWLTRSTDDGQTWSDPLEITRDVKRDDWTWYATGPGVGIRTRSGRLVIPCDHYLAGSKARHSHVIYSDDAGQSWTIGGVAAAGTNECQVVELSDGRLMLNMRNYNGQKRRAVATSDDGGLTWSDLHYDDALVEPVCQAGLITLDDETSTGPRPLVFTNPASPDKREKLTVRLSDDDGQSWPFSKLLHDGPAAYSCPADLGGGAVACLYECGDRQPYETITFARFDVGWLRQAD